jgi:hypothetical protein
VAWLLQPSDHPAALLLAALLACLWALASLEPSRRRAGRG